jgi:hypothetical protein
MPWELQTFVCVACSAVTTRQSSDDTATSMPSAAGSAGIGALRWLAAYDAHTAMLRGQTYRIVAYPRGSPLAGKYGCYRDGRYTGLTTDLAAAKALCGALAAGTARALAG